MINRWREKAKILYKKHITLYEKIPEKFLTQNKNFWMIQKTANNRIMKNSAP